MMKNQFEKHEGSICDQIDCFDDTAGCSACMRAQKIGWIQALEWVDSMMEENLRLSDLPNYKETGINVHEAIQKEINDVTE